MSKFSDKEHTLLRGCELLRDLSDKNFDTFINLSQRAAYNAGEVLLEEGKHNDYLYILISGTVNLYKSSGTEQCLIGSLPSGQSIGEMRIIKNKPCSLTVITDAPTVVLCILLSKLRHLEYNQCYESILDAIINILSYRLVNTNNLVANKAQKKEKQRKLFFPLLLASTLGLLLCELGVAIYYFM